MQKLVKFSIFCWKSSVAKRRRSYINEAKIDNLTSENRQMWHWQIWRNIFDERQKLVRRILTAFGRGTMNLNLPEALRFNHLLKGLRVAFLLWRNVVRRAKALCIKCRTFRKRKLFQLFCLFLKVGKIEGREMSSVLWKLKLRFYVSAWFALLLKSKARLQDITHAMCMLKRFQVRGGEGEAGRG